MSGKKLWSWHTALILALIAGAAVARLVPHVPNVAPVAAVALLGGAFLARPWAVVVPLAAMAASDYVIGFYSWPVMASVYGSFLVTVLLGMRLRKERTAGRIAAASLSASIIFYLVTNAAVWKFSGMYAPTLEGLVQSYYMALPFFRNTLLGDLMYTAGLFAAAEAALLAGTVWPAARRRLWYNGLVCSKS